MLKEAIRFHYSWQPNFLTTEMIVSLVGSYVGHAMILHKKLRRLLAMKCRSQSEHESPIINKLDSTTTDYSTSDIDSDEARK